jgi:cytochrome c oxidase subunit 2
MPLVLPSRSRKTAKLAFAFAGSLLGMALSASPALAFSLNPDAGSAGIEKINTFHWIMFVVIVVAIVAINLAILRAVRPRHRHIAADCATASGRGQLRVGLGLGVLALAIFVTASVFSSQAREVPTGSSPVAGLNAEDQLEIKVTGQQWLWRYDYPNGAFSYHRLVVPADTTVALDLVSADVIHGWNVPSLTGKAQAVPGKTNRVYFRAEDEGEHPGRASVLSGQGYDSMEALVEVVSPDAYETFVKQLKSDIQDAQDAVVAENESAEGAP